MIIAGENLKTTYFQFHYNFYIKIFHKGFRLVGTQKGVAACSTPIEIEVPQAESPGTILYLKPLFQFLEVCN
jgi:hypothetical protein